MYKPFSITVDTMKKVQNNMFTINTNDLNTPLIVINVLQNGKPVILAEGVEVRLAIQKPDGKKVFLDCQVNNVLEGECEVKLTTQAYLTEGLHVAELMLYYASNYVSVSTKFSYSVIKGILDNDSLESANEWPILNQAIAAGEFLKEYDLERLAEIADIIESGGGTGGGSAPSNVILFEDWTGSESVIIDTGNTTPTPDTTAPVLTITPNGGTFATAQSVTMSTNETAEIFYTLDGTTPTVSSTKYTSAINLSDTTTVKVIAKDTAGNISTVKSVTFTKDASAPADTTPPVLTITPAGTFTDTKTVNMSATDNIGTVTIWYTLDDSNPIASGTRVQYTTPLILTATDTVKAYAVDTAGNASAVQTVTYTKTSPVSIVSDSFNRADNVNSLGVADTGQTWITAVSTGSAGVWGISSNHAYQVSTTATADFTAVLDSTKSDLITVQADFVTVVPVKTRLIWRYVDKDNYYLAQNNGSNNGLQIYKRKAGVFTSLGTSSLFITNGNTVKVKLNGNTHEIYINDSLAKSITDTDFKTATMHGLGTANGDNTSHFDNFSVTTF
ncbi:chitobiase/beta-hexosaminidase C-terminal domain-containing protein [Peribacillus sp. NJ11]|uniref:chitobiase/beta-hexosaminidase C-terminal domain-containing protein n=1 Tax=Peribacillus sp. NJ11 TaxID=3055861 RepID=UPI0025A1940E|nr:chitobiase/beta-hexosaminidase C-terminal domain-containing protein [Peribacillus sp. NJ11]MDM5223030.1 chitobiase/beta-hexosaminidase C-terminal domain-containing protein [Peribacillus sp. NJ11]